SRTVLSGRSLPAFGWSSMGNISVLEASAAPEFGITWLGKNLNHTPSAAAKMTASAMPTVQRIVRPRLLFRPPRKLCSESCGLGSFTFTLVGIGASQACDAPQPARTFDPMFGAWVQLQPRSRLHASYGNISNSTNRATFVILGISPRCWRGA